MNSRGEAQKWLVHFSGDDWWHSNPHSRHHITNQFYRQGYRVLWVNPMGLRFPSIKKGGFSRKIYNKLLSLFKMVRKDKEGFYVYTPFFLPVFRRGAVEQLNASIMYWQFRIIASVLGIKEAVGFVTLPTFAPLVRRCKRAGIVGKVLYYYSDQYDQYREIRDPEPIRAWDRMLQEDADAIYCASAAIRDGIPDAVRSAKVVRVIDHQVDFDMFDYTRLEKTGLPIEAPVIGYFGSLSDSNDWAMIEYAAKAKPEWNFVFIGKKLIALPELEGLPNVHFLGYIAYESLPEVAANFTVGIMFWKMTDWIRACSPLKLKEYLALGLPVVSVPIDEVVHKYSDYVEIAANGPEFVEAISRALGQDVRSRNRNFARQFSWNEAVAGIMQDNGLV